MVCPGKTPKQCAKEQRKKDLIKGLNKAVVYISYLNYSDRTVDRIVSGMDEFEPYRGAIIRNVDVRIIEPFGVSVDQPESDRYTKFQKFANKIQFKTKDWVVRNELLFKHGDRVNPILFADTEKNLWEQSAFKDLKIFIVPVEGSDDNLVDIVVLVQQRWSWSITTGAQYNKAVVGISFQNLLGLPMSVAQAVSFNYRKDNPYTVYGHFEYDNIKRSHIDTRVEYEYENLSRGVDLNVSRKFYSANALWAGHLQTGIYREYSNVPNALAAAIPTDVLYNWQDVWLASSIKVPGKLGDKESQMRLIVSGRFFNQNYMSRPYKISSDGSLLFLNHTYLLGSVGLANWNYYVDHQVYSLGNAEYFSKGFNAAFIAGFDQDEELQKRFYSCLQMNYGGYIRKLGYINTTVSYSGFLNRNRYDQILGKWSNSFFSAPVKMGRKFMLRQFISSNINLGFNRPNDREIIVNNYNGVRGIFTNYIKGQRSYVFNFETDIYPSFKVLGFSSAVFIFADLTVLQQNSFADHQLCQGYGGGIRLRNLGLGIDFFELSFVYYPNLNIPGYKPYTFIGGTDNSRGIPQNNLFLPAILTPDNQYKTPAPGF